MVNPVIRHAMFTEPHDFIHLQFRNSKAEHPKIIELYNKGLSLREIESQCGVAKSVVRKILIKSQIPLRSFAKENPNRADFITAKRGAKPPYGFWYIEGCLVRHPKEYPVLLQVISQWKKGQPLNSIATQLNSKKVPSPMGKKWSWNSIDNIIQRIKTGHLVQKGDHYELR